MRSSRGLVGAALGLVAVLIVAVLRFSTPSRIPEFHLTDLDGRALDGQRFEGKVVLIDFWATWCGPCRVTMPQLQDVQDRWEGRGFTVVGISVDQQGPEVVERFVAQNDLTYPIAIDDPKEPVAPRFGVRALPTSFLVDREGKIVKRWTGTPDPKELEDRLTELLVPEG